MNGCTWRYSAALREFEPRILNGVQRAVNRKVQGSNHCSGVKSEIDIDAVPATPGVQQLYSNGTATSACATGHLAHLPTQSGPTSVHMHAVKNRKAPPASNCEHMVDAVVRPICRA